MSARVSPPNGIRGRVRRAVRSARVATRWPLGGNLSSVDREVYILVGAAGHRLERTPQRRFGRRAGRRVIRGYVRERPQAVIDTGVDFDHVEPLLDQRDRRQKTLPLQAVG